MSSPRDRYLTVFGRRPVLEVLVDESVRVARVHLSDRAQGEAAGEILSAAKRRGVMVQRVNERRITEIARDSRHHQGVVADVVAPGMARLEDWLPGRSGRSWKTQVLVLDQVHNPANVGMILRTATAAGIDGVVIPERGTACVGPVAIKASAGVAFRATMLRVSTSDEAVTLLKAARFDIIGLAGSGDDLWSTDLPERGAFVLGNESAGLSVEVDRAVGIALSGDVESLNVATAAAVVCFEVARRRRPDRPVPGL